MALFAFGAADASAACSPFTVDPFPALTGYGNVNLITFTYTPPPGAQQSEAWDLDGDGQFNDAFGETVERTYPTRRNVTIGLRVSDSQAGVSDYYCGLPVNGPSVSFVSFPSAPVIGEQVTFVYSPGDPDGGVSWDLNGDGAFSDAQGPTAFRSFEIPGTYPVAVRATDNVTGAVSTGTQLISVNSPVPGLKPAAAQPRLLAPFPIVRITGRIGRRGARIKRLTVNAPFGASITVRCRGRGCPFHLATRTVAPVGRPAKGVPAGTAVVRIRKLEKHLLRNGANIKVYVSKSGSIGKFTRFKIRRERPPLRHDLCLVPGKPAPSECPQT